MSESNGLSGSSTAQWTGATMCVHYGFRYSGMDPPAWKVWASFRPRRRASWRREPGWYGRYDWYAESLSTSYTPKSSRSVSKAVVRLDSFGLRQASKSRSGGGKWASISSLGKGSRTKSQSRCNWDWPTCEKVDCDCRGWCSMVFFDATEGSGVFHRGAADCDASHLYRVQCRFLRPGGATLGFGRRLY